MDEPDPDLIVKGLCNHKKGHRFSELKMVYDRVAAQNERARTRGIFRDKFVATRIERRNRKVQKLDAKQQRVFEEYYTKYLELIQSRGQELTYQRRFSALCNARRRALAGSKPTQPFYYYWSKTVHMKRLYERFMMEWLKERRSA